MFHLHHKCSRQIFPGQLEVFYGSCSCRRNVLWKLQMFWGFWAATTLACPISRVLLKCSIEMVYWSCKCFEAFELPPRWLNQSQGFYWNVPLKFFMEAANVLRLLSCHHAGLPNLKGFIEMFHWNGLLKLQMFWSQLLSCQISASLLARPIPRDSFESFYSAADQSQIVSFV